MTKTSPRSLSARFLSDVVSFMKDQGLSVEAKPYKRAPDDTEHSHIRGLNGWTINAAREFKFDISGGLDTLERDQHDNGSKFSALIQYRTGRSAPEQYAVLSLATLVQIIHALEASA